MTAHAEHAKGLAVIRVIELVGVSEKSWSDATQQAVVRVSKTTRHITGLDVLHSSAVGDTQAGLLTLTLELPLVDHLAQRGQVQQPAQLARS